MKSVIFILLMFLAPLLSWGQIDPTLATALQNEINNSVSIGNNGVSSFLIMPDGTSWYGTAGVDGMGDPITDTTLFHGASTTKFNVAILMLLLEEEGLLDLDDKWSDHVTLAVAFDPNITVRQLLNSTSGIADYLEAPGSGANVTADFSNFFTPQYILENVVSDTPDFQAGMGFNYSNSNYVLAGLVVEAVTGNPLYVELRNRIWGPLGLEHTYFGGYDAYTEPTAGVWWDFGSGVMNYSGEPTTSMLSYAYAAGNIVTCPQDLAHLLDTVLNGQVLNASSLNDMKTYIPASFGSWTAGYGLGIHHQFGQTEDEVIGHDGYYTNMTDMFHSENHGFTLVTMTNTQTAWFAIFDPMYDILADHFETIGTHDFSSMNWSIFPNPAMNNVHIESDEVIDKIEVKDVHGKLYQFHVPASTSFDLHVDNVVGIFYVSVESKTTKTTQKLIIN